MAIGRKRNIVTPSGKPEPQAPEQEIEHSLPEEGANLTERVRETFSSSLYIPVPAIIIGFVALIVFSFSLTVVVTYWPASGPEVGESPRIKALEAAVAPEYGGERTALLSEASGAEPPVAAIEVDERSAKAAAGALSGTSLAHEIPAATGVGEPVAEIALSPKAARGEPGAGAAGRRTAMLTNPLVPAPPIADIRLTPRRIEAESTAATAGPAEGAIARAHAAYPPIAALNPDSRLPALAGNDGLRNAERVAPRRTAKSSLTDALGLSGPVALLELPRRAEPAVVDAAPGHQKLMFRRYAKAVLSPEFLEEPAVSASVAPQTRTTPSVTAVIAPPPETAFPQEADKPWQRYAAAIPPDAADRPKIVIIIDDMGNSPAMADALSRLPGPLNFAFLPYAPNLERQTELVRSRGHELMVHLPMEPEGSETPGPHALYSSLDDAELRRALEWNLSRFSGFVGVNNHMGSHLTADSRVMEIVLSELKARGLLFLDSLTTPETVGPSLSRAKGLPWAGRDVFLDNVPEDAAIHAQLMQVEQIAGQRGLAIAIGHPHRATLRVLQSWIPTLEEKGLILVPLSAVVNFEGKRRLAVRAPASGGN